MRILCLGAGAIGGYFGGRLQQAGSDVVFLVRERRKEQLERSGLVIESQFGNYAAPVRSVLNAKDAGPCDIILLTCKAYDLPSAVEAIAPAVESDTAVLPLLNGVAHLDALNAKFGRARVLGGTAKIAATLRPDGTIHHLNDWRYITFGEQDGSITPRVDRFHKAFDEPTVIPAAVANIMQVMWEKLVHLSTVAGMTCLMRASVGEIASTDSGADLMVRFLETNAEIAAGEGFRPSEKFMDEYRSLLRDRTLKYTASMLRDIEARNRIEGDHVVGYMLQKARKQGRDSILHEVAYTHLQSYEQRRAAGRF
jgi:2-dehydropantoate 2-reductase